MSFGTLFQDFQSLCRHSVRKRKNGFCDNREEEANKGCA